ncbi:MAG TPA: MBL fold metallo-hydrolase [Chthonomonadaceae bacterium]|nr:MBL fold metallo-hydrolase [Chthonomonadaceae bacterium]
MDPPRLIVFSTPLVSTWALDETHRLLFDVGDGAAALLEGKIHRVNLIALTHAHRDHIAGLPQFLNLRGGVAAASGEPLRVLHPDGSGSFLAMGRFLAHFDQATSGRVAWQAWRPGDQIELEDGRFLRAYATRHVPSPDPSRFRCLGYQIGRTVMRLKPELRGLPQAELDRLRAAGGREAITAPEEEILLTVTGDTSPLPPESLQGTRFLLHECTFLDSDEPRCAEARERGHEHSCLSEVLDLAQAAEVEHVALYHISKRYTDDEILRAVRAGCARRDLKAKVSVALPGRVYVDLFAQTVWPGKEGAGR